MIKEIRRSLDAIRDEEVKRVVERNGNLEGQEVHHITRGLMNKILHRLVTNIKLLEDNQEERFFAYDLITRLFKMPDGKIIQENHNASEMAQ